MNHTFCALPFYRTTIRNNGGIAPCCLTYNYSNLKDTTVEEFWQSDRLNQLRQNMLLGVESKDCELCYKEERSFGKSMRTESLRDHSITSESNIIDLVQGPKYLARSFPNHLEFHVGNLCNLKCLTCRPQDSSSFLIEDKILKISNYNQQDFQMSDSTIETIMLSVLENDLEVLDFRGGETMLMPSIKKILNDLPAKHNIKCLRLQTNCTVLDDSWKQILQQFESVEIMMSIDAFGDANHYIRYPSQWETIEKNVDYFLSLSQAKLYVNCTISNINFLVLPPLIDWCRKKGIYFHFSICSNPTYYHYTNLPGPLLAQGLDQLKSCQELAGLGGTHNDAEWNNFCHMIDLRDQHRGNSIFDIIPEFRQYWKKQ